METRRKTMWNFWGNVAVTANTARKCVWGSGRNFGAQFFWVVVHWDHLDRRGIILRLSINCWFCQTCSLTNGEFEKRFCKIHFPQLRISTVSEIHQKLRVFLCTPSLSGLRTSTLGSFNPFPIPPPPPPLKNLAKLAKGDVFWRKRWQNHVGF